MCKKTFETMSFIHMLKYRSSKQSGERNLNPDGQLQKYVISATKKRSTIEVETLFPSSAKNASETEEVEFDKELGTVCT
jgi:hypothetical protein